MRPGFGVEQDHQVDASHRFVELTPPGSSCSIALTAGYVDSEPGSLQGVQVNVEDIVAARSFLLDPGSGGLRDRDTPVGPLLLLRGS